MTLEIPLSSFSQSWFLPSPPPSRVVSLTSSPFVPLPSSSLVSSPLSLSSCSPPLLHLLHTLQATRSPRSLVEVLWFPGFVRGYPGGRWLSCWQFMTQDFDKVCLKLPVPIHLLPVLLLPFFLLPFRLLITKFCHSTYLAEKGISSLVYIINHSVSWLNFWFSSSIFLFYFLLFWWLENLLPAELWWLQYLLVPAWRSQLVQRTGRVEPPSFSSVVDATEDSCCEPGAVCSQVHVCVCALWGSSFSAESYCSCYQCDYSVFTVLP